MRLGFSVAGAVGAALVGIVGSALAQYIFLDANQDGKSSASDRLSKTGTTAVEVWLDTDRNKDRSMVTCIQNPVKPMSIFSYEIALVATGGTVEWGPYVNYLETMTLLTEPRRTETEYHCFYGGALLPPGRYKLGRMDVRVTGGNPAVEFVSNLPGERARATSYGSPCPGILDLNTIYYMGDIDLASLSAGSAGGAAAALSMRGLWRDADRLRAPEDPAEISREADHGAPVVRVNPNPANPEVTLTVSTTAPGFLRVKLFDISGRLVRYLVNEEHSPSGSRVVRVNVGSGETRLASGIYVYRVEALGGTTSGRIAIVK